MVERHRPIITTIGPEFWTRPHRMGCTGLVETGERWGYRARSIDDLDQVEILRLGTRRPARVQIRFVALEYEGREEWVPPARLKVPWERAEAFTARERRWDAARELSIQVRDTAPYFAASRIIDDAYPDETVMTGHRSADTGLLLVGDLDRLLGDLGWDRARFVDAPAVFHDDPDGVWVAPWPVTEAVARALAPIHAETLLADVAAQEDEARHETIHGKTYGRGKSAWEVSPEVCAEVDQRHGRPIRELLRAWCGHDAVERRDELDALRVEVGRLGRLVDTAVEALRAAGDGRTAARLEKDLGVQRPT